MSRLGDRESDWWPATDTDRDFLYWAKCEDVAIHFNELIVKMRTQSLGGLAALAAVMGWATKAGTEGSSLPAGWIAMAFLALLIVWTSIGLIDWLYYGRLLKGAVDEIKRVERLSKGRYELSIHIDEACGIPREKPAGWHDRVKWGRALFYGLPFAGLSVGLGVFTCRALS